MNRDLSKETYFKQFTALEPCFRQCYTTNVWKEVFVCIKCVKRGLCVHEKRPVQETNERDGFKTHQYRGASLESAKCVATNVSKEAYMYKKRPIKETNEREVSTRLNTFELCLSQPYVWRKTCQQRSICMKTDLSKRPTKEKYQKDSIPLSCAWVRTMRVPSLHCLNFSKVSSLLNLLYSMTAELTFENFSKWCQRPMAVVSACCNTLWHTATHCNNMLSVSVSLCLSLFLCGLHVPVWNWCGTAI